MTPLPSCPSPRLEAKSKDTVNEREEKREPLRRERKETERKAKKRDIKTGKGTAQASKEKEKRENI